MSNQSATAYFDAKLMKYRRKLSELNPPSTKADKKETKAKIVRSTKKEKRSDE